MQMGTTTASAASRYKLASTRDAWPIRVVFLGRHALKFFLSLSAPSPWRTFFVERCDRRGRGKVRYGADCVPEGRQYFWWSERVPHGWRRRFDCNSELARSACMGLPWNSVRRDCADIYGRYHRRELGKRIRQRRMGDQSSFADVERRVHPDNFAEWTPRRGVYNPVLGSRPWVDIVRLRTSSVTVVGCQEPGGGCAEALVSQEVLGWVDDPA